MSFPKFDTADRIYSGDTLLIDGKRNYIAAVFDASTQQRQGILGFLLIDPNGSLSSAMQLVLMEGGWIADFIPNMARRANMTCFDRPRIQVRRRGLGFEAWCPNEGGWEYLSRHNVRHLDVSMPMDVERHLFTLAEQNTAVAA